MTEAAAASVRIEVVTHRHLAQWLPLRYALWPDTPRAGHAAEAATILRATEMVAFIALADEPAGLAEASLRRDHVNGCDSPIGMPVAFLEGLYVALAQRRRGIARALCQAVADWGRSKGCIEVASDTSLENIDSQAMHRALGFAETERVVFFRRALK
jgi:aminoglycoside 6'-N-acetyltransferase I